MYNLVPYAGSPTWSLSYRPVSRDTEPADDSRKSSVCTCGSDALTLQCTVTLPNKPALRISTLHREKVQLGYIIVRSKD